MVTNDHAERGVSLVHSFSGKITKDEDQLQFLLQTVEDSRRRIPNTNKETVLKGMK